MIRDFVVVDDGNEVPSIKYCKSSGPLCCIESGSIVEVKIDEYDSVYGLLTDVTESGIRLHVPTEENGLSFGFDEIRDIVLVSGREAVSRTLWVLDGLRETYGKYPINEVLHGHRVDLDA